jgi:hypothetical protein
LEIEQLQVVHAQLILLTEDMSYQRFNMWKFPFWGLVPYWFIEIEELVNHWLVVDMIRNSAETIVLGNSSQKILAIVLA